MLNCIQKIHTTELVLLLIRIARVVERMLLRPQVIILSEEIFDLALRPLVAEPSRTQLGLKITPYRPRTASYWLNPELHAILI